MNFRSKPVLGSLINPYHQLSKDLLCIVVCNEVGAAKVFGQHLHSTGTFQGNAAWVRDYIDCPGNDGDYVAFTVPDWDWDWLEGTMVMIAKLDDNYSEQVFCLLGDSGGNGWGGGGAGDDEYHFGTWYSETTDRFSFYAGYGPSNDRSAIVDDSVLFDGSFRMFTGTWKYDDATRLYINGVLRDESTDSSIVEIAKPDTPVFQFGEAGTNSPNRSGDFGIKYFAIFRRQLRESEIAELVVDPYLVFRFSQALFEYAAPPTTAPPTTLAPTTLPPTTLAPTTLPTTPAPTTLPPTTLQPTSPPPTTKPPTTTPPTTLAPTTLPTTAPPTTLAPTTLPPTTLAPTTLPTTVPPTTLAPTTLPPTTLAPTTLPTTSPPTTLAPTTLPPTTLAPTTLPTTAPPTTLAPTTLPPTTLAPTTVPTTSPPTTLPPTTLAPTTLPTTSPPTTLPPTTLAPTTLPPTTEPPTSLPPTTLAPTTTLTTLEPTTAPPLIVQRRGIRNFGFSFRDSWR